MKMIANRITIKTILLFTLSICCSILLIGCIAGPPIRHNVLQNKDNCSKKYFRAHVVGVGQKHHQDIYGGFNSSSFTLSMDIAKKSYAEIYLYAGFYEPYDKIFPSSPMGDAWDLHATNLPISFFINFIPIRTRVLSQGIGFSVAEFPTVTSTTSIHCNKFTDIYYNLHCSFGNYLLGNSYKFYKDFDTGVNININSRFDVALGISSFSSPVDTGNIDIRYGMSFSIYR